ncbi:MAG: flagellar biosynthesis protein FlgB [Rhodobacter sp.]|uniref:flagellar basal body protein n=1 Tax=Pararhodobacter sp. TaxID=2127056 RepID=UPI001D3AE2AB|nr:flagellar basal body protein [Pararhodobacter sp.]MCB1346602.1 flagellar biosynthesis protein FlgB [Paracoccaceae bacterium]MCC0072833.1 flagellar biosynthesis protein FlgB [Rhodobacter sp.]HPD90941.1 flagellar basal body protein [Pararhodobacter sp.]
MFQSLDILRMAQAYATHAATRQQAIAQNVANADTPGYRARDAVPFSDYWQAVQRGDPDTQAMIRADATPVTMAPDGNTVSLEFEMMRGVEARQQHETALGIYSMTRDLMRAVIGR